MPAVVSSPDPPGTLRRPVPGLGRSAATRADLDIDIVQGLLARVRNRHPRAFRHLDDDDALVRLHVLTQSDGVLRPTLGGLLCLGSYPQQYFPQLFISEVVLPGTEIGDQTPDGARFLDNVTVDGPIPTMLMDATAVLQRNMRKAAVRV
jgi:ATP-dependent DNA helicase RecG